MLPGKRVAILGLGISGYTSAVFLKDKGYSVFVSDGGNSEEIKKRADVLKEKQIDCETGGHDLDKILASDWVMLSPGIAPHMPVYQAIKKARIPILSEIEAAFHFSPTKNIVAVTGTSGKTTVSHLISDVLKAQGFVVALCGNIGNPWMGELSSLKPDHWVVLELSSFQLKNCHSFKPHIGVLLNVSRNHEDWHPDFQDYVESKLRMFRRQSKADFAVLRSVDQSRFFSHYQFESKVEYFDLQNEEDPNYAAVLAVARLCGIGEAIVQKVFKQFSGIEHRMEILGEIGGIRFVNDSKATTTASLEWALKKQADHSVVLIAGGHPKTDDFQEVEPLIKQKVKCAVLIGEARGLLKTAWSKAAKLIEKETFEEAVRQAFAEAKKGDVVLLSPACASFDMFKNYQHRGTRFKEIFRTIRQENITVATPS